MALDTAAFVANFIDETRDNIKQVDASVVRLSKDPGNVEELNTVLRALHTIKGSSRMLKFHSMEKIAHGMESLFKGVRESRYPFSKALMSLIFVGADLLRKGIESITGSGSDAMETRSYEEACERASSGEPFAEDTESLRAKLMPQNEGQASGQGDIPVAPAPSPLRTGGGPASGAESIRVKLEDVSDIIEILNKFIIRQFQLKKTLEGLGDLEREVTLRSGAGSETTVGSPAPEPSADAGFAAGGAILKSVQDLRKAFADQMTQLEQNSFELQERVMKLSMLPMALVTGELPRMVAETSASLGKEIDFSVMGSDILMDKAVLEKLNDPLLHLVRNAVDHGIETPAERKALGKSAVGKIEVACKAEGGNIIIRVTDDGKGLDRARIRERAMETGLISQSSAEAVGDGEIYSLIFRPGFSTRKTVTDLSGRGVGLDIVKHNIDLIKGKIGIKSREGGGSEFILSVPLSLATVSGFFCMAGGEKFLIPSNFVQRVVRLARAETVSYFNKEGFRLENEIIPLYSLALLLGRESENRNPYLYALVVESAGERMAVIVDAVLQHASLIYKPVPRNIQKLKLVQGIVFDENYRIINILFVPELISRFRKMKSIDLIEGVADGRPAIRRVLVVDDSLNTREIEKSILELEGFEVECAADGIEGLDMVKTGSYDLIVSDVEMPRMDGVTMIENIRKDSLHATTPIVVVTSYSDEDTTRRIREAGADAHIVKSDFDRNSLLATVERLLADKGSRGQ